MALSATAATSPLTQTSTAVPGVSAEPMMPVCHDHTGERISARLHFSAVEHTVVIAVGVKGIGTHDLLAKRAQTVIVHVIA